MSNPSYQHLSLRVEEHVCWIGLNRPEKYNAFDTLMLRELAESLSWYNEQDSLRCAVLFAHGEHFTSGLDLAEVGPAVASGEPLFPPALVDPFRLRQPSLTKPLVLAAQGWALTIGTELALAADIRLAAEGTRFGQIEVKRGIFPFGGATLRLPQLAGWGNAMRYLLTGDLFDAEEAYRLGVVQEVCVPEELLEKAGAIARTIAAQAPLAVQASLASSRECLLKGEEAAAASLVPTARRLMETEDAREGMMSFVERREARFQGR